MVETPHTRALMEIHRNETERRVEMKISFHDNSVFETRPETGESFVPMSCAAEDPSGAEEFFWRSPKTN